MTGPAAGAALRRRRGRRWLLFFVTLAIPTAAGLWLSRRVLDPRMVGAWTRVHVINFEYPEMTVHADGTGERMYPWPVYLPGKSGHFRWQVQGDCVVVDFAIPHPELIGRLRQLAYRFQTIINGASLRKIQIRCEYLSDGSIRLDVPDEFEGGLVMRRLSN
ncbi:MAG TPA: hypothetical protein VM452_03590 [Caulifigura sp.]|jgi:hypothetical protein|nr:hypothetical protein [Caulifigura sp.]